VEKSGRGILRSEFDRKIVSLFHSLMHVTLRILLLTIGCIGSAARAELVFEQTQLELHPAIEDETAVGHFKYENKGDKPIAIKSVTTSCGCTAASAKQSAAPGEKGEVTATFKIADRTGLQQKAITVVTDDSAHPSTTLTLKVAIPQVLELQPTFVYWQAGETPKAKTILAKAGPGVTVKKIDVNSSNPNFVAKVEPGPSPNQFQINIEPRETAQAGTATLTIKPALEKGAKMFYATASVTGGSPAATRPAGALNAPVTANGTAQAPAAGNIAESKSKIDACALLLGNEIQSVQGEPLKDSKPSGRSTGGLAISQCYFALPTSSNSISLTVTQKGDGPDARDPKAVWQQTFHREKSEEKGREEEEGERESKPEKVAGVGDEAFWMSSRVSGELFALKGNSYIRVSVGGTNDATARLTKSKEIAEMVLKRL
jgi:Protein of unknown function (DUF1573)